MSSAIATQPSVSFKELFQDFIHSRQTMGVSYRTIEYHENTSKRFVEWCDRKDITPPQVERRHIRAFLAELQLRGLSPHSVHAYFRAIRTLMRYGTREHGIPALEYEGLAPILPKKRLNAVRPDAFEIAMKSADNLRDQALLTVLYESGIRRAEAVSLNWRDLEFGVTHVTVVVRAGKGQKDRTTYVRNVELLEEYRETVPHDDHHPVFVSLTKGTRLTEDGIYLAFRRLSRQAGLRIRPHDLRRGMALRNRKMNTFDLARLLGYEDISTTQRYVNASDADLLESYLNA